VQKMFELLARHHGAHDAHAGVAVERPVVGLGLHALLQPALLLRHLDIHVLAADFAAIGLAQGLQDFAQGRHRFGCAFVARKAPRFGEAAGEEFAVQIPDGEAVGFGVEFGVVAGFGAQRVEIGDQVAAHAVGVDHLHDPGFLGDLGVARGVHAGQGGFAVGLPAHRLVRHAKVGEYLFVEPVLAIEQGLHAAQEHAGFGALYDAVIVGAGERHHFADAQHGARLAGGAEVFGGVTDGAGGDDGALADHEARAGGHGADGAGVGERNGGALEIGGGEFGAAGAGHKVVESGDVFLETERASVLDVGHHEAARAVLARHVDGDAEVHLGPHQTEGLAVALGVGVVESGDFFQGFDDGPADEVGVGNFAAADEGAVLIDDAPVFIHHLDGDGALRGSERNGGPGRHVCGNAAGGAAQGQQLLAGSGRGRGDGDLWGCCRGAVGQWAGLFEYVLPAFIDGGTVVQVLLIQLVFEPAIDAHFRFGLRGHWGGETFAFHDTKRPCSVAFQAAMPVSVPAFFPLPRNAWNLFEGKCKFARARRLMPYIMLYSVDTMRKAICLFLYLSSQMLPAATGYLVHNLVADDKSTATADFYDPRLINPWGNVASATSPFWVCDLGLSTIYTVNATNATPMGTPNATTQPTVPGAGGSKGSCTGIVSNIVPATTPPTFPVTAPGKAPVAAG